MRSTKLCVTFENEPAVDTDEVLECIGGMYDIGYAGISCKDTSLVIYFQTSNSRAQMVSRKVQRSCEQFGKVVDVSSFTAVPAEVDCGIGEIRKNGRGRKSETHHPGLNVHGEEVHVKAQDDEKFRVKEDEEIRIIEGKAYACRAIPSLTDESTFGAVYGSSNGAWETRFWVGPLEILGVKDKKCVTVGQKTALLERQKHLCQECFFPVSIGSYSNADIDHIIPRRLGGTTDLTNLQVLCVPCHRTKTSLESRGVKKTLSDLGLDPTDKTKGRMYAVSNTGALELRDGFLNPVEYMKNPDGVVGMSKNY